MPNSYGTAQIQDGTYIMSDAPSPVTGVARLGSEEERVLSPVFVPKASGINTFIVDLHYRDYKYVYGSGKAIPTNLTAEYSKHYQRIVSSKNPVAKIKSFVSQYAGKDEASKLRKRMIAIERMHGSISNEVFRFGIGDS